MFGQNERKSNSPSDESSDCGFRGGEPTQVRCSTWDGPGWGVLAPP